MIEFKNTSHQFNSMVILREFEDSDVWIHQQPLPEVYRSIHISHTQHKDIDTALTAVRSEMVYGVRTFESAQTPRYYIAACKRQSEKWRVLESCTFLARNSAAKRLFRVELGPGLRWISGPWPLQVTKTRWSSRLPAWWQLPAARTLPGSWNDTRSERVLLEGTWKWLFFTSDCGPSWVACALCGRLVIQNAYFSPISGLIYICLMIWVGLRPCASGICWALRSHFCSIACWEKQENRVLFQGERQMCWKTPYWSPNSPKFCA